MENKKAEDKKYEELTGELSEIMKRMESSEITLEEQIEAYEKGMDIIGKLNAILKNSEARIMMINKKGEEENFE